MERKMNLATPMYDGIFKKLGINIKGGTISAKKQEVKKVVEVKRIVKNTGKYTVLENSHEFRRCDMPSVSNGAVFKGDTFNLIGDEFMNLEGKLYRKAKIVTCFAKAFENRIGWLCVDLTNAPKEQPVQKLLSGSFRVHTESLKVNLCDDMTVSAHLEQGDSVDFDPFNETITKKDCVYRKVIVKDSNNEMLLNQKVWMPLMKIKNEANKAYKIKKNIPLLDSPDSKVGLQLCVGDSFKITDEPIQCFKNLYFKKVMILSSKDASLQGKMGWIEIRHSNAFTLTVKLVEEQFKKNNHVSLADQGESFKLVKLNYDMLAFEPECNNVLSDKTIVLKEGQVARLYDKYDSFGKRYLEVEEIGTDNIKRFKQYTVQYS